MPRRLKLKELLEYNSMPMFQNMHKGEEAADG